MVCKKSRNQINTEKCWIQNYQCSGRSLKIESKGTILQSSEEQCIIYHNLKENREPWPKGGDKQSQAFNERCLLFVSFITVQSILPLVLPADIDKSNATLAQV